MALVPLQVALVRGAARTGWAPRSFALGLCAGAVYFTGTLYWTVDVMVAYGGLSRPLAMPVAGLLVAYLALYPAFFGLALGYLVRSLGPRAQLAAPALWVASELARAHLFTGFPWVLLGYSQATVLPVAQLASVAGVFGLSALVCLPGAALAWSVAARDRRALAAVGASLAVVAAAWWWGGGRIERGDLAAAGTPVRVGVVQGNVPQGQKWDPAFARDILDRYVALSRRAATQGAALVVWPESATPFYYEEDPAGGDAVRRLARETGAWLLFGSDQLERGPVARYYNAAFLLDPAGATAGVYRKVHLVPFGEYVPLRTLLFFAAPLVESVSDFSAGTGPTPLSMDERPLTVAICYEAVFPHLVRDGVLAGSQLLTTVTNDAWYGRSSAPFQHFEQAALRAIEQGRYLVRAANTGVSGIVDPYGRVIARSALFETEALVGEVRWLEARTLYATIGDSFAWACALVSALALVTTRRGRRTRATLGARTRRRGWGR